MGKNTVTYRIPVIPLRLGWEADYYIDVKKHMVDTLVEDFNAPLGEDCSVSTIARDQMVGCDGLLAFRRGKEMFVTATFSRKPVAAKIEEVRQWLLGQCSDGWGENGIWVGEEVVVYTWEPSREPEVVEEN